MIDKIRDQLIREDLSGVTFVRDYLQLQFNPPPLLNVYSRCEVRTDGAVTAFGEPQFPNAIISCIGEPVSDVIELKEERILKIILNNGAEIVLHYSEGTYIPPEAIEYSGPDNLDVIWP